ncbi:bifunctional diaminohydroxyphosphoribosylaminopyrimidine deaminase/5-amino-6-(5-phosphoribosylamino)uracil reductase RibD [Campylobacter sp. Cr9]|uniref:bifunctional diaminohydroxyphosphoribosylaminopyrimidine deaminase/5-amino-6-(5-phosphoribosylamino)uracil reductase RibD n=1 Tax=Campylobacter sp. Cr9 TaxID=2735728 RepID=UPI003014B086|nr:bifunctional diaminohydroxyphosphoribosylaminopyrimidine deaminase/5-amino-6-(5-phosphoribosylamino)uracil reductase RibD [Campylobacter sp. Cr9]
MSLALKEAWKYQFLTYPNPAVGCLVLDKYGKILSIKAHKAAGTFHAERLCVNEILENYGKDALKDSTFYVTLEPCSKQGRTPPCHELLIKYGVKEVFIGSSDESQNGINELRKSGINVVLGVLKDECDELIKPFKFWLKNEPFVLFKLAINLNFNNEGSISNEYLRAYFHEIRSKLDTLIICGNTLRFDNPMLDARFSTSKKAPNLLIFSKHFQNPNSEFKFLNIFKANRSVEFGKNPLNLKEELKAKNIKFAMIEGGFNALELFKNQIDWLFLQQGNSTYNNSSDFKLSLSPIYQSTTKDFYNKPHEFQQFGFYEIRK